MYVYTKNLFKIYLSNGHTKNADPLRGIYAQKKRL